MIKSLKLILLKTGFGNDLDLKIYKKGQEIKKGLEKTYPNETNKMNFYLEKKRKFETELGEYGGEFKEYFNSILGEINLEERMALGYGIHSD